MKFSLPSTFIIPAGGHVFSVIRCSAVLCFLKPETPNLKPGPEAIIKDGVEPPLPRILIVEQ
jgi:hypothetical protein